MKNNTVKICYFLTSPLILFCFSAYGDSALAWEKYQEGRNPLIEAGMLAFGIFAFLMLLKFLAKMDQKKKEKRIHDKRNKMKK